MLRQKVMFGNYCTECGTVADTEGPAWDKTTCHHMQRRASLNCQNGVCQAPDPVTPPDLICRARDCPCSCHE